MSNQFIVPTGFIIKEYLDELGLNQKNFAMRMDMSEKHVSNLLNGKSKLTEEVAIKLEKIIHDVPASYWLNYEIRYREYKVRNNLMHNLDESALRYYDNRFKFSTIFSGLNLNLREQANEMLKLLRISNFEQFNKVYYELNADFMEDGGEKEAIAIWLNMCAEEVDIQNKDLSGSNFNKDTLIESLTMFKKIALNSSYQKSINSARKLLNQLGVYLVLCDAVVNSKVRGAITTYKRKPAIYLSGRFKTHDHIWFALMHEIGHLIHHFVTDHLIVTTQDDLDGRDPSSREEQANQFARDFFINNSDYQKFISSDNFSQIKIEDFAKKQSVLPGIVLGRLQHDGYIDYKKLSYLKNRE